MSNKKVQKIDCPYNGWRNASIEYHVRPQHTFHVKYKTVPTCKLHVGTVFLLRPLRNILRTGFVNS